MTKLKTEQIVFASLLLIHVGYIWIMPVFLTQDGPSHLYSSRILLDLVATGDPANYHAWFDLNTQLFPNWFSSILLSALLSIATPLIAEKIFISLLIISLPLAVRYALRMINPTAAFLAPLSLLLANSYFLIYGFYNFQWSIVFLCLFIAYYSKHRHALAPVNVLVLALFALLLFFTHPVALLLALALLAIDFFRQFPALVREKQRRKHSLRRMLTLIGIALPALLLFGTFFFSQQQSDNAILTNNRSWENLRQLLEASHLWVFTTSEKVILLFMTLLLCAGTVYALFKAARPLSPMRKNLLILVAIGLFVYFCVNDKLVGGAYLTVRMTCFIYLFLLLLAATGEFGRRLRTIHLALSAVLCIAMLVIRFPFQYEIGKHAQEYIRQAHRIEAGKTVLPLSLSNGGQFAGKTLSPRIGIFKHISGYVSASGKIVSFDNYEANTQYFPLRWVSSRNPYRFISVGAPSGLEEVPPAVDITGYNKRAGCHVDYVILWGNSEAFKADPRYRSLKEQLAKEYRMVHTSKNGYFRLFRKNENATE